MQILDIHTHHPAPQPEAVIAVSPADFDPVPNQFYSVGIHPWDTIEEISTETWSLFEQAASHPQVVAIGECGIDLVKGGPLYRQMQTMRRQAEFAEKIGKPVIIHNVHAQEEIIGIKKDLKPTVGWLIHGFRGKPTIASMLLKAGFLLSFGRNFNDRSLSEVPADRLLAETDEADCTIQEVITVLSSFAGRDLTEEIAHNTRNFLNIKNETV